MNIQQFIKKAKTIHAWGSQLRITYWIIPSVIYGVSMNVSALELSDYLNSATVASSAAQFETNLANNTDDVQVTPNAELTLVKIVENDDGGDAVVADFTIATNATVDPLTFTSSSAGTTTTYTSQVMPVAPGTYTFDEVDFAGYTEGSWACLDVDSNPLTLIDDTFDAGELSLAFGVQATCTITNDDDAPGLTIVKDVTNDNGGNAVAADFTLRLNGGAFDGSVARSSGDTPTVVANTAYTLSEDALAGYTQTTIACVDDIDGITVVAHPVTLAEGQSVTCTISNDDDAASLIIVKDVVNDNGGDAVVADFNITTTAGALVFDAGTTVGDTTTYTAGTLTVDANTAFDLAEIDLAGYTEGTWSCDNGDGGAFDAGSVTLDEGATVTCTISNDDDTANLIVVKDVVNDDGGNAVVGEFSITTTAGALVFDAGTTVGDTTTYTAGTLAVDANTAFDLAEINLGGYTEGAWICDNGDGGAFNVGSVTLDEGATVTCTISNDDDVPGLTIVKAVVNDNGGNAVAADFVLHLSGGIYDGSVGRASGDTPIVVANTEYTLSEDALTGYTQTTIACVDDIDGITVVAHPVTLAEGQSVTCTISNDDDPASLIIVKDVVNDNGGDAVVADFNITTTAGALVFDAGTTVGDTATYTAGTLTVDANTAFDLAEIDLAGYTEGSWTCDNGGGGAFGAGSVTLDEGATVTCTISNDDDAATLTIVKEVLNDNGGTGVVGDFGIMTDAGGLIFDAGTTVADTTTYTATTLTVDANTPFSLSENDLDAYTEGAWMCTNGDGGTFDSGSVTLDEGDSVICTINNDDRGVDLSIVKTVDDMTPDIGDTITFSLEVSNAGPDEATDVSVTDVLPAGFTYGATIPVAGVTETTVAAPNLAWTIASVPSGGSVTIQFTATVLAP